MTRSYSELMSLGSFEERFEYLKLSGRVGDDIDGHSRAVLQDFYRTSQWKSVRNQVIVRDEGCDLGDPSRPIFGPIHIHHINPITDQEVARVASSIWDPENLICTTGVTHRAIHYGNAGSLFQEPVERTPNDTCPWKGGTSNAR